MGRTVMELLAAASSTDRAPVLPSMFPTEPALEYRLVHDRAVARPRPWRLGSLLATQVFVLDYEIILGHDGPYYELQPRTEGRRRVLSLYTSRTLLPRGADPADAEPIAFADVLAELGEGVEVVIDPGSARSLHIDAEELLLLRRATATR